MLLMIDNHDSFTFNLVQYLGELGEEIRVRTSDALTASEVEKDDLIEKIVISPGPGTPEDAGASLEIIKLLKGKLPILGVCLGHQAIASTFGGKVVRAPYPVHGKPSFGRGRTASADETMSPKEPGINVSAHCKRPSCDWPRPTLDSVPFSPPNSSFPPPATMAPPLRCRT